MQSKKDGIDIVQKWKDKKRRIKRNRIEGS